MSAKVHSSSQHPWRAGILDVFYEDIARIIISHLSSKHLVSLCLVSKSTQMFVEPFLYSDIKLEWSNDRTPGIVPLLDGILRRPSIGEHIRRLELIGDDGDDSFRQQKLPPIPTSDDFVAKACKTRFLPGPLFEKWGWGLHLGEMDALLALLMAHAAKLKRLWMGRTWSKRPYLLGHILLFGREGDPWRQTLPDYASIEEIVHQWHMSDHYFRPKGDYSDSMMCFLRLPNLKRATIGFDTPMHLDGAGISAQLVSSKLTGIREKQLNDLLRWTHKLRHLDWRLVWQDPNPSNPNTTTQLSFDDLMNALFNIRGTLEDLYIGIVDETSPDQSMDSFIVSGSLRPLSGFKKLKSVRLPSLPDDECRTFFDMVPQSVEDLVLVDDLCELCDSSLSGWRDVLGAIRSELPARQATCPSLKSIILGFDSLSLYTWPNEPQQTIDLGLAHGVVIRIDSELLAWYDPPTYVDA